MNLEEKATDYATNKYPSNQIERVNAAEVGFEAGYTQCKTDLIEFLKVNHRASVKDILKHLEGLV